MGVQQEQSFIFFKNKTADGTTDLRYLLVLALSYHAWTALLLAKVHTMHEENSEEQQGSQQLQNS